jgi:tyrosyl-tRNA synthetase
MSKSYDNYIGISDTPQDIYGRTLSIPDNIIYNYYEVATDISKEELSNIKISLENPDVNPRDLKRRLGRIFVEMYHSKDAAEKAEEEFDNIFINKGIPEDISEMKFDVDKMLIIDLIALINFAPSKGEARRLIQQGGVSIDGNKVTDFSHEVIFDNEKILKVGKRKFLKLLSNK